MKFENIDLVDALRRIMDIHTQNYKEDFELDAKLLYDLASSSSAEDKHLLWMSRPNGTYLLPEREVYVEDSYENKVWEFYHDQTRDPKMDGLPLNRALRDGDGEVYDIIAGNFMVVGLTEDNFGSLSPDLQRQFTAEFKMPEQFAKIGDRIVAIPMISEEQQKQTVLEEKSSIVNENTSGMAVDGHIGTWHTIDHKEIDGHTFWLMEHDTFGDDASCIIVDERGELVLSHVYDGFDENTVDLLRQEVMPVDRMPDDSISVEDMKQYGYKWGGMLPMREEAAADVMKSCQIYRLYGDDTEGLVLDAKEIREHAAKGGIFGVEKAEWAASQERQNPLKAAEMSVEDDYGMIDGIINNGPKEAKNSEKSEKASIMDRLKSAKAEPPKDKTVPSKERKPERDL